MPTIQVPIKQTRPLDATPERALSMYEAGVKQGEMSQLWGISRSRVSQLICKGRRTRAENGSNGNAPKAG